MSTWKDLSDALDDLWVCQRDRIMFLAETAGEWAPEKLEASERDKMLIDVLESSERLILRNAQIVYAFKEMHFKRWIGLSGPFSDKINDACDRVTDEGWRNFVYSLSDKYGCLYVGRTNRGQHRFRGVDQRERFRKSRRLVFIIPHHAGNLDRLECLTIHYHKPRENRKKASIRKYSTGCPVCKTLAKIEKEVYRTFRLK